MDTVHDVVAAGSGIKLIEPSYPCFLLFCICMSWALYKKEKIRREKHCANCSRFFCILSTAYANPFQDCHKKPFPRSLSRSPYFPPPPPGSFLFPEYKKQPSSHSFPFPPSPLAPFILPPPPPPRRRPPRLSYTFDYPPLPILCAATVPARVSLFFAYFYISSLPLS